MMRRVSAMSDRKLVIVFALFPGVTQLDFTGPHQVFSRLPGATVILTSGAGGTVEADGIIFAGLRRLADIPACDVICVPGGGGVTDNAIHDEVFLGELRRLAATARFVTSDAPDLWRSAQPGCCTANARLAIGCGASCCCPSVRHPIRDGWSATATSSPAAASRRASISR
jgi:hypothetical protein